MGFWGRIYSIPKIKPFETPETTIHDVMCVQRWNHFGRTENWKLTAVKKTFTTVLNAKQLAGIAQFRENVNSKQNILGINTL